MSEALTTREPTILAAQTDLPSPVFRGAQMVQALAAYRELQKALDESMPDQLMELDDKPFRKKGYWRAISVAFNLTVEPTEERREVSGAFTDGRENFGYIVTYRATSASGRAVTGDGSCFAVEKARRFKCPHPESPGSKRTLHFPHDTCPDFDPNFQWKTLPAQATEHNIRSHAHTRAMNRAISNLVGFGEVSAEEVEHDEPDVNTRTVPKRADGSALVTEISSKTGKSKAGNAWTMYLVTFDDGRSGSTFDESLAKMATDAKAAGALLIPALEQKGQYWNLIELKPVKANGASPQPPGAIISREQVVRFHAVARTHGWTDAEGKELLAANGYASSKEITVRDYQRLVDELKARQPDDSPLDHL